MPRKHETVSSCPVCGGGLTIHQLACDHCDLELKGRFGLPRLARLPRELQDVVEVFLKCRGNIKEMERELGISYPTVSRKLDAINLLLLSMEDPDSSKARVLRQIESGELTVTKALALLKSPERGKEAPSE